ncbi:DUF424 family protein [Candidatus Bathyarchaeota archaeon]|nr:DUF424 family protein [Candidatus Bathyarchaeota archaeon]
MPVLEAYVKIQRWGRQVLLAACDADILGKTFKDSGIVFEVKEEFYKGFKTSIEEAINLVEKSTIVNLVGTRIVKRAIERGYVHPEAVMEISGVLHAQIVKM